jgi:hypothetical protein
MAELPIDNGLQWIKLTGISTGGELLMMVIHSVFRPDIKQVAAHITFTHNVLI